MYSTLRGSGDSHKRRVSMAMEILMKPRLLILDDVAVGLNRSALLLHIFWKLSFVRATDLQQIKQYVCSPSTVQGLLTNNG
jgi:ABC-type branched-subunit amino acid transport system ATPase component